MTKEIAHRIGRRIRELRKAKGFNQADLALLAGKSAETVSRVEKGATVPSIGFLEVLAAHLGVDIVDFFTTEKPNSENSARYAPSNDFLELMGLLNSIEMKMITELMRLLLSNRDQRI